MQKSLRFDSFQELTKYRSKVAKSDEPSWQHSDASLKGEAMSIQLRTMYKCLCDHKDQQINVAVFWWDMCDIALSVRLVNLLHIHWFSLLLFCPSCYLSLCLPACKAVYNCQTIAADMFLSKKSEPCHDNLVDCRTNFVEPTAGWK